MNRVAGVLGIVAILALAAWLGAHPGPRSSSDDASSAPARSDAPLNPPVLPRSTPESSGPPLRVDIATAPIAPPGPGAQGAVELRIPLSSGAYLPFSFAMVLVPENGFGVRIERAADATLNTPVRWGALDAPPWVRFHDVDGSGTRLQFSGLSEGRWAAWAESHWESYEPYLPPGVPTPGAVYAAPVSFEVGAQPTTVSLRPVAERGSATVAGSLLGADTGIPVGIEVRTASARWLVGVRDSQELTVAPPVSSWIPAGEDVTLTPVWTSVGTPSPLESRQLHANSGEVRTTEWPVDAVLVNVTASDGVDQRTRPRSFQLRVTPIVAGQPDERASISPYSPYASQGSVDAVLRPGRYRFSARPEESVLDEIQFERTIEGPGPITITIPFPAKFAPIDIVTKGIDGRSVTFRYQDGEAHRLGASGARTPVHWSREDPPEIVAVGNELLVTALAVDEDGDPDFHDSLRSAARVDGATLYSTRSVSFSRVPKPKDPTGRLELYVVDEDGRPVSQIRLLTEFGDDGRGWIASGGLGRVFLSGLPIGRHRIRVARSTDPLYGSFAAVAVIEVRADEEGTAYIQLPPR